jgi:hypothetical protein
MSTKNLVLLSSGHWVELIPAGQNCTFRAYGDNEPDALDFERIGPPWPYPVNHRGDMPFLVEHCKFEHALESRPYEAPGWGDTADPPR